MPLSDAHRTDDPMAPRTVPILTPTIQMSGPSESDPMEIATPTNSSAPPSASKSPDGDTNGASEPMRHSHNHARADAQAQSNNIAMPAPPPAAAPAVQGPKIVQTAFIHKLYK